MSRKRMMPVGNKFWEKMTTYMMLMGYPGDGQVNITKELNRRIWKRKSNLSLKRCKRLLYILYASDTYTLLSYTVGLGRIVWNSHLKAKQRKLEKYLAKKIKRRTDKKKLIIANKTNKRKENCGVPKMCKRNQIRPNLGPKLRVAMRRSSSQTRQRAEVEFGSPMYRFAMAIYVLSFRNLCVNSEWEFWTICITKEVCGFWKSIAFGEGLSDSLVPRANELGLYVVSQQVLERLESCYGCSSSVCQPVPILNGSERILRRKSKA